MAASASYSDACADVHAVYDGDIADIATIVGREPGYFEIMTAAAFRWFADVAVDVAAAES